jgi:23S rRNA (adenine2503-C2)-methyltransferase
VGRTNLKNLGPEELEQFFRDRGEAAFRARQVGRWLYRRDVTDFAAMTDLSLALRGALSECATADRAEVLQEQADAEGCRKFLVGYPDGCSVETVYIPEGSRRTLCVSTQTGCALGCLFCATGRAGPGRDLRAGEIVEQVLRVPTPRPSHVVVMGMGEPLLNVKETLAALRLMTWPYGLGIGPRRITVSTIGIPGGIRELAASGLRVGLAVSLNAATDGLRRDLMPAAHPLAQVLRAAREFAEVTARPVTLEYVQLPGVNDTPRQVGYLVRWARSLPCKVNVIPYNPVHGVSFRTPTDEEFQALTKRLWSEGLRVTARRSRGSSIGAACGQLGAKGRPDDSAGHP